MWKNPKHEPTDSYFYITIKLAKCMVRADTFNLNVDPVRTHITGTQHIPFSHVCPLEKRESKRIIVDEILSQVCSTYKRNNKSLSPMKVLKKRANQKGFTKA